MVLLVSLFLLLAGCVPNAPLLAEAMQKDYTSLEAKSTLTFDTNLPVEDEDLKKLLQVLKSGIDVQTQMKDSKNTHQTISLQDPSLLVGSEIWPGDTEPVLDVYMQGDDFYLKTTADNKFLGINDPNNASSQEALDVFLGKLTTHFLTQNKFALKNVETIGEETILLPNGKSEKATHFKITMNFAEVVEFLTYTVEYLSTSADFENFVKATFGSADAVDDEQLAEMKKELSNLANELKALKIEELKASGWDAQIVLNSWINADKLFVQNDAALTVNVPFSVLEESGFPAEKSDLKSVSFTVKLHEQYWNHNKAVTYPVPPADQIIMMDKLAENPELVEEFSEESPIGQFVGMMFPEPTEPFADVPESHWAFDSIMMLKELGIVNGYGDNQFKPNQSITRSEFVAMAVKSIGLETKSSNLAFKDKQQIPAWANEYWQTAVASGLIKGYEDNTLRPNQKISRAEMITILVRGMEMPLDNEYQLTYADTKEIPAWAVPYVKTATANGMVKGNPDNRFEPKKNASRAEVATVLYNVMFGVPEEQ